MLSITFLGHHGWLFASHRTSILVDPLLLPRFGGLEVHPPRRLDLDAFPAIDALVLTSERDDHFDLASLDRLERTIPVYLPPCSSSAAPAIAREMGFSVSLLRPGRELAVGDLRLLPLAIEAASRPSEMSLDELVFLLWEEGGGGSFFSAGEAAPGEPLWRTARARAPGPGIWCYRQPALDWSFVYSGMESHPRATQWFARRILEQHESLCATWDEPAAALLCGPGFSFPAPLEALNAGAFSIDVARAAEALAHLGRDELFLAPHPGMKLVMQEGTISSIEEETDYLARAPESDWPDRTHQPGLESEEPTMPSCGRTSLGEEERAELRRRLDALAAHLVGRGLHRRLATLATDELEGHAPTFALALREADSQRPLVLHYDLSSCSFVDSSYLQEPGGPVAIITSWASDLLAALRRELSPLIFYAGSCRVWSAAPERVSLDLEELFGTFLSPLARPALQLERYRRLRSELPAAPPSIHRRR